MSRSNCRCPRCLALIVPPHAHITQVSSVLHLPSPTCAPRVLHSMRGYRILPPGGELEKCGVMRSHPVKPARLGPQGLSLASFGWLTNFSREDAELAAALRLVSLRCVYSTSHLTAAVWYFCVQNLPRVSIQFALLFMSVATLAHSPIVFRPLRIACSHLLRCCPCHGLQVCGSRLLKLVFLNQPLPRTRLITSYKTAVLSMQTATEAP